MLNWKEKGVKKENVELHHILKYYNPGVIIE
jgi:hypothetical protein